MSLLTGTQRYAGGALFSLATHHAQAHDHEQEAHEQEAHHEGTSVCECPHLWVHPDSGLLRPVFTFLRIDSAAWPALEQTAASAHPVGPFIRLLSEDSDDTDAHSSSLLDQQLALSQAIDNMESAMQHTALSSHSQQKHREYVHQCRQKYETPLPQSHSPNLHILQGTHTPPLLPLQESTSTVIHEEVTVLRYERKVSLLYQLLSACLSDLDENNDNYHRRRKGYDARHRAALRLLATWLDIKWTKMEAIETMVACSAMAFVKEQELKKEEHSKENKWAKWKRGGIIGAAAITGGTLLAITGGLAAPAIAAGLSALAPTLGTLVPIIGSGFAAAASAAGTVAGSVAVAASFGAAGAGLTGSKMARRVGSVDEFEFKAIGENHNQGRLAVQILVSGFVFEEDDFIRPWEGQHNNLERYALQWESKNLIAVSTAIQDWLTSRLAMELMKQGAMLTVLSTLLTALAWPATLLAATDFIDSKWAIAIDRSDKVGKLLAEVLLKGLQGNRPVTLIGYSLGARVIFKCLQFLAETENNAELVERVVLLGAPISIKDENWEAARKMVAGRFINAYTSNDWMLGVAFRASLLTKGLAGIQPINIPGIQNVDVTDHIEGHSSYLWATQNILDLLDLDSPYPIYNNILSRSVPSPGSAGN